MDRDRPDPARSDGLVALVAGAIFVTLVWLVFANSWPADLGAIYFGALSYAEGDHDLIYRSPEVFFGGSASAEWAARAAELGHPGAPALPYVYAPLWAALLAPVARALDPVTFFDAALILHAVLCALGVVLAYRIAAPRMSLGRWAILGFGALIVSGPVFIAFWLNQPQILVTFLILLAFERYKSGAMHAAGLALGLAAALKIAPAALALIFVMDRAWRPTLVAVATGLVLLGASVLVAGVDLHHAFLAQLQKAGDFLIVSPLNYGFEALVAAIGEVAGRVPVAHSETLGFSIYAAMGWAKLVGVGCFLAVAGLVRRPGTPLVARLIALWSALVLFGPLGWNHYLIGPILLLPAFLTGPSLRIAALILLVLCGPVQFFLGTLELPVVVSIGLGAVAVFGLIGLGVGRSAARRAVPVEA